MIKITPDLYVDYLEKAYQKIHDDRDYITDLDLATGDGDHWSNMDKGFSKIIEIKDELRELSLSDLFKKIGMTMMSVIGGSSGVLYGGAYIGAAKVADGKESLDREGFYELLNAMNENIMQRGKTEPGHKTMVDALDPAVKELRACIDEDVEDEELLQRVSDKAREGAKSTADMEAIRGRATYQGNKGIGHLDPGAVTMAYQIETLCETLKQGA